MPINKPTHINRILPLKSTLRSGLIAWWRMDDGVTAVDSSGLGNKGIINSTITQVDGQGALDDGKSRAYFFNDNTTYVSFSSSVSTNLSLTGVMSAAFWINVRAFDGASAGHNMVIANSDGGGNTAYAIGFNFSSDNKLDIWHDGSGPAVSSNVTGVATADQLWHHVVITRTGSAGSWTVTFYVDGANAGSGTTAINPTTGAGLAIGRFGTFNGYYINAWVNDMRVYNRALSAQEANMLYNGSFPAYAAMEPEMMAAFTPPAPIVESRRSLPLGTRVGSRSAAVTWPG